MLNVDKPMLGNLNKIRIVEPVLKFVEPLCYDLSTFQGIQNQGSSFYINRNQFFHLEHLNPIGCLNGHNSRSLCLIETDIIHEPLDIWAQILAADYDVNLILT